MSHADVAPTTNCPYTKVSCAVKGPMIVIRARPDGMGEKFVNVLKQFLKYTRNQDKPSQQSHSNGLPSWQLFEVIGDLGESDQTELYTKLSSWARLR